MDTFNLASRMTANQIGHIPASNLCKEKRAVSSPVRHSTMTVQKPSKPSKSTSPFNLFVVIGIAVGVIAAGAYFKPFITNPFDIAVPDVSNTSVPLTHETIMARYANGCPPHQFKSVVQVSRVPNIMLIDGFVTPAGDRSSHSNCVLTLTPLPALLFATAEIVSREPLFEVSTVVNPDNTPYNLNTDHRNSWTAYLPVPDPERICRPSRC